MKKIHILSVPTQVEGFSFEDLWNEISLDWPDKAEQLQIRRWRELRRQIKSGE